MKPLLYILLLWLSPGILHAQSGTIAATISFQDPSPSCGLYGADDLSFGSVRVPGSGTVSVTVNAQNGRVTTVPSGHSVTGASVGDFYVDGDHVSSYSIGMNTQLMPNALTSQSNPSNTIPYAATTATSLNGTTWSSAPTPSRGQFYSGSAGGTFSSFRRYFRIGGTISSIRLTTPRATYSATVTLRLSCS